jgi:hypothetical protein
LISVRYFCFCPFVKASATLPEQLLAVKSTAALIVQSLSPMDHISMVVVAENSAEEWILGNSCEDNVEKSDPKATSFVREQFLKKIQAVKLQESRFSIVLNTSY